MSTRRLAPALLAPLLAACGGAASVAPVAPTPQIQSFTAEPPALYPGEPVHLVPLFSGGAGRIEPDVGAVESGVPVLLKPGTTAKTYALRVEGAGRTVEALLPLGIAYRDRLDPVANGLPRADHAAALLDDGRVLVAGGSSTGGTYEGRTELWDPETARHEPTGDLDVPHASAAALLDGKGRVLVTGGLDNDPADDVRSRLVHAWTPATGAWTQLQAMLAPRTGHTATLLPDGRVLIAGGDFLGSARGTMAGEEIYDPGGERPRPPAGQGMLFPRSDHTATPLPDGRILIAGGRDAFTGRIVPEAELFDPVTETFTPIGLMVDGRANHVAVPLPDGSVLLAGGDTSTELPTASAELYRPADRSFVATGALRAGRIFHAAVALSSGDALIAGGMDADGLLLDTLEVYRPSTGGFETSASRLPSGRTGLALVRLADGRVLVHGGRPSGGYPDGATGIYR